MWPVRSSAGYEFKRPTRSDPRFESIAFLERFDRYLHQDKKVPRIQAFRTVQGKIDLILLPPATAVQESL